MEQQMEHLDIQLPNTTSDYLMINEPETISNVQNSANLQIQHDFMPQETNHISLQAELNEKTINIYDELRTAQLSKNREHQAKLLAQSIHIENEFIIKAQVKEEAVGCILQSDIQKSEEELINLNSEFVSLDNYKEDIKQEINLELMQRAQVTRKINKIQETNTFLTEYSGMLDENYKNFVNDLEKFEKEQKNKLDSYFLKKQDINKKIGAENEHLKNLRDTFDKDNVLNEYNINEKDNTYENLTSTYNNHLIATKDLIRIFDDKKQEYNKNNEKLLKVSQQNTKLLDMVAEIDLKKLEEEKTLKQQKNKDTLDSVNNKLKVNKERLHVENQRKSSFEDTLESKNCIAKKYEATVSHLQDDNINLLTANQSMEASIEEMKKQLLTTCNNLDSDIQKTDNNLSTLQEKLNIITIEKNKTINSLQSAEQSNEKLKVTLVELENIKENLITENSLNVDKVSKLHQSTNNLHNDIDNLNQAISQAKDKYLKDEEIYKKELFEVDQNLTTAQIEFRHVQQIYEAKASWKKTELNGYKVRSENIYMENKQSCARQIKELEEQLLSTKNELRILKEKVSNNETAIEKKKESLKKVQRKWEEREKPSDSLLDSQISWKGSSDVTEPVKLTGILRSAKKRFESPKRVSFDNETTVWNMPSSSSSINTDVPISNCVLPKTQTSEQLFEALLGESRSRQTGEDISTKRFKHNML